ncbi:MAG: 4Fe-4S binding protein [Candidatus Limnocylindrales bacterium]
MLARPGWVRSRKAVQALALIAFVGLFLLARRDGLPGDLANIPMRLDPLLMLASTLAARAFMVGSALALATLVLTLLFGRAWCGWLCPLGTMLDLVPVRPGRGRRLAVPEGWRKVKYVLFFLILFAALLGNQTLLFLDPLAIFFRTLTAAVWPALDQIATALETLLSQVPGLDGPISSLDTVIRPVIVPAEPVSYQDLLLFASFFVVLVALNALAPRFWCRYLCPLGGFLGLISRVALFRREATVSCNSCGLCAEDCPTGTIDPARNYASDPAECTVCMECLETCPLGAVKFKPSLSQAEGRPYDPSRREFLLALGAAAVGIALFRSDLFAKRESPFLLRPPGSRESNPDVVALTDCTRCSECVRVCPTGAIQPAVLQAGLEGLGTPVLVPRLGYCDYGCNACGQICPTQAIPLLSLEDKQRQVIGKAYIDQNRCLAWSDHQPCIVCEEMCPLPDKAIRLEEQDVWRPDGGMVRLQLPHVVRDLCIGCGLCEYRCPVSGDAAIRVYVPRLAVPF